MTFSDGLALLAGGIAIFIGCVGKTFYYAKGLTGPTPSSKRAPRWMGRVMFICVGVLIIAIELKHLFVDGH
jgi:hypothetical protein